MPDTFDADKRIVHMTSENLWDWKFESFLELSSERVIDACAVKLPDGSFKLWYKDECDSSHTHAAVSSDLYRWRERGAEITDCPHEGPNVFTFGGKHWLIADCWDGLAVYESDDFSRWKRKSGNLLRFPGKREYDGGRGAHADVLVHKGRAYILYFTHPYSERETVFVNPAARTVLHLAELTLRDGTLFCDRDKDLYADLSAEP